MSEHLPEEFSADLILVNCKVYTADQKDTIAEAIAVKNGRVLRVGSTSDVRRLEGKNTKVTDLGGRLVLPGFIDSHEHCIRNGLQMDWVKCGSPPMNNLGDIIEALKTKAKAIPKGKWVIGHWFDESKLVEKRFPNRYDLDLASSEHPIYLGRAGGHNSVANSLALEIAGITKDTPQPQGGRIDKDANGEPTGRLDEIAAMNLVKNKIPVPTQDESIVIMVRNWSKVEEDLLSWGITTVHEAHIKAPEAIAYQELLRQNKLRLRVGLMLDGMAPYAGYATSDLSRQGLRTGFSYGDKIRIIGVKVGVDGAMGSRTAAFYKPYEGEPNNLGIVRVTQDELTDETIRCHKAGLRACIHAIGDRAIDMALEAIEAAVKQSEWKDHRHRIEHVGYAEEHQIDRMKRLGVLVSASIGFCYPIGDSHLEALGKERMRWYYPMRSLKEKGIVTGGNSDGFGSNWAITGIHGCVNRTTAGGETLYDGECIPRTDAIKVYTINGAYLEGAENEKGILSPGMMADMVVLDRDILTCPPQEIVQAKAMKTFVGGELVYNRVQ